jgi:hypothetical protein
VGLLGAEFDSSSASWNARKFGGRSLGTAQDPTGGYGAAFVGGADVGIEAHGLRGPLGDLRIDLHTIGPTDSVITVIQSICDAWAAGLSEVCVSGVP